MALIKFTESETVYVVVTGRLYGLKFRESVGEKQKPMASFAIAYDIYRDEFGNIKNRYMNCVCWSVLAEYIGELQDRQDRPSVMICGKLRQYEYENEQREQIECDFIQIQQTTTMTRQEERKAKRKKNEADDFDDINF